MNGLIVNEDILIKDCCIAGDYKEESYDKVNKVFFIHVDNNGLFNCIGDPFVYMNKIKYTNNLHYNKNNGKYYYIFGNNKFLSKAIYHYLNNVSSTYRYQTFDLDYSCNNLLNRFKICANKTRIVNDPIQSLLDYSFGLEFETNSGIIPEHLCYSSGLIPLRDGSISGYEYSTIILGKTYGLSLLKNQLNLLKEYTSIDKECSLHIHFGKLPINMRFIYILYIVCHKYEREISKLLPKYAFQTSKFKKSHKDYCKPLPFFLSMSDMYNYYAGLTDDCSVGEDTIESVDLSSPHPYDPNRNRKWNIGSRYHWVNFVNLMFYKTHKTVEFRCLNPTRNFNKIVTWLFIFTAFIKVADNIYHKLKSKSLNEFYDNLAEILELLDPNIKYFIYDYYRNFMSENKSRLLNNSLIDLEILKENQEKLHDYIGQHYELDDLICTTKFIK